MPRQTKQKRIDELEAEFLEDRQCEAQFEVL
jgi:hypothetical protein